jgi:hypothetical protein
MLQVKRMVTINSKAIVVVMLLGMAVVIVAAVPFQRKTSGSSGAGFLRLPKLWDQVWGGTSTLHLRRDDTTTDATLWHTLMEKPVMVLPATPSTVLCIYDFDVGFRVLVFDKDETAKNRDDEISTIVTSTNVAVRMADANEIEGAIAKIREMGAEDYEVASVPTLDLGVLRMYVPKANLLERLDEALQRQRRLADPH